MRRMTMTFRVEGVCTQEIDVPDSCPLSCEDIVGCLNGNKMTNAGTELNKGGQVIQYAIGGNRVVGHIKESDFDAELTDFRLDSIDYSD